MQYSILLNTNENTKELEEQEKNRFVRSIIDCLDIPIEFNPDTPNVENKIKLKRDLQKYKIFIVDDYNGGLKMFLDTDLIAEWHKCKYKLKEDVASRDPKNKLFMEMQVNFWSVFEETPGEQKT